VFWAAGSDGYVSVGGVCVADQGVWWKSQRQALMSIKVLGENKPSG